MTLFRFLPVGKNLLAFCYSDLLQGLCFFVNNYVNVSKSYFIVQIFIGCFILDVRRHECAISCTSMLPQEGTAHFLGVNFALLVSLQHSSRKEAVL